MLICFGSLFKLNLLFGDCALRVLLGECLICCWLTVVMALRLVCYDCVSCCVWVVIDCLYNGCCIC